MFGFLTHEYDAQKHLINTYFHIRMHQAEKQPVFGPPESLLERVLTASRAMKTDDWNACFQLLINDKMNGKTKA